jgi:hypothetical protein
VTDLRRDSRRPPGEEALQELLGTGLTAGRLVSLSQAERWNVWPANEFVLLNGDEKPVIRITTQVRTSGRGAADGHHQMWILR